MFRENKKYQQVTLFGIVHQLPAGVKKILDKSWSPAFRKLVFEKVEEKRYAGLYSEILSRPNFPVNVWVGLEIIKGLFDYTDEELIEQFHFNLLTAYAVGQEGLGELTLCPRTIYYNRERLLEYEGKTGRNLIEEEFKGITDDAFKRLGVDTSVQRMDSSFVGSFMKQMSRLELTAKVLQNFYRDMPDMEKERFKPLVSRYIEEEAEHISFRLRRSEVEESLKKVGELLLQLHETYAGDEEVSVLKSYQHIGRVLKEQFNIVIGKDKTTIEVKPAKEISASSLQNPADDEATFRRKQEESHQGYEFNIGETCAPKNPAQLLTDVAVYQNITSDESIAVDRIPEIKERTGVTEMIVDANFTGKDSEEICKEKKVELVPTEIKGRRLSEEELSLKDFKFTIEDTNEQKDHIISCPAGQSPEKQVYKPDKERHIIHFSQEQCGNCSMARKCPVMERKNFYSLLFNDRQVLLAKRRQNLDEEEYRKKCHLRAAIEGTVSQFKQRLHNGKLRVRGYKRVRNVITFMAMGINFRRIWAYMERKGLDSALWAGSFIFLLTIMVMGIGKKLFWQNHAHQNPIVRSIS
jgi:hypothetical protein